MSAWIPSEPSSGPEQRQWPEGALELARSLQQQLAINDRDWHALKSQRCRRASEQIAAALVQLLAADDPAERTISPARLEAIALLEHAIGWLKAEISDPGCPSHGR
ncbi:MAG: DUF6439 family protein [Cyanobium sp.]